MQADGLFGLERGHNRGDAGDLFRMGGATRLAVETLPNTQSYKEGVAKPSGNVISVQSHPGSMMNFTLSDPVIRIAQLTRLADGTMRIWIRRADGKPLDGADAGTLQVYASPDPGSPFAAWMPLAGKCAVSRDGLYLDDPSARFLPWRFYRLGSQR
jgi:hypothetical protein